MQHVERRLKVDRISLAKTLRAERLRRWGHDCRVIFFCDVFCGNGHEEMKGWLLVLD